MPNFSKYLLLSSLALALSNCSQVDSTKVFDQEQAAYLLNQGSKSYPTKQLVKLSLANKSAWKKIDMSYGTVGSPFMLIPLEATRDHWQQSIRTKISPFAANPDMTADKYVETIIANAKKACERVSTDHLELNNKQVLYQLSLFHCGEENITEVQIGKAFTGVDAVYVVYYTAKSGITDQQIRQTANTINKAVLMKNPSYSL